MRILLAALIAALPVGVHAQATESYIVNTWPETRDSVIVIDTVTSTADGYVLVFDQRGLRSGTPLGRTNVNYGANRNVNVRFNRPAFGNVVAVLFDDQGTQLASRRIRIDKDEIKRDR